jgi:ankyrin repeat protein
MRVLPATVLSLGATPSPLLAQDNVDPGSKGGSDRTPLSWAAEKGHEEVVELLLAKENVDPDSKDETDRTPLSWAAEKGHEAVVKLLLATDNVDPDSKDRTDRTPLSWAAEKGHEAVVELLLATRMIQSAKSSTDELSTPLQDLSGPMNYVVPQLEADRKSYNFYPNLRLLIDTVMQCLLLSALEPPIPEGKVRARWKCVRHPTYYWIAIY